MGRVASAFPVKPGCFYVYVIGHDSGPQKVGYSGDPAYRAWCLKVARKPHFSVHYQLEICAQDVIGVEVLAHWLLRDSALGKEWFNVTPKQAAGAIDRAAAMYARGERAPPRSDLMVVPIATSFPVELLDRLTAFRAKEPGLPNRSEAIRILVNEALEARSRKPSPPSSDR